MVFFHFFSVEWKSWHSSIKLWISNIFINYKKWIVLLVPFCQRTNYLLYITIPIPITRNTVMVIDTPTMTGMLLFMEEDLSSRWGRDEGVTTCKGAVLWGWGVSAQNNTTITDNWHQLKICCFIYTNPNCSFISNTILTLRMYDLHTNCCYCIFGIC